MMLVGMFIGVLGTLLLEIIYCLLTVGKDD